MRVLQYLGWEVVRQRGSHVILTRTGQPGHVAIPTSSREVPIGTFRNVLRQASLSLVEFDAAAEEAL